jgi:two-component system, chemotaxis family, chemotaxis protein CheY
VALILVMHDYEEQRKSISLMLTAANHTVIEATNGADGLKKYEAERPDLVITDIFMPEMDGIEALLALRAKADYPRVIVVSADTLFLSVAQTLGADAIIAAPFSRAHFNETVTRLLEDGRRKSSRRPVLWIARLDTDASSMECLLLNISLGGAMLQIPAPITSRAVTLALERFGSFTAEVKWQRDNKLGIRFTDPPDRIAQAFAEALALE